MNTVTPRFLRPSVSSASSGSRPRYLHKRGGRFYFKRKIPSDVAHGFPEYTEQVWKTLGTSLLHVAKVYLAVEVTEFELKVAQLRRESADEFARALGCISKSSSPSSNAVATGKPQVIAAASQSTEVRAPARATPQANLPRPVQHWPKIAGGGMRPKPPSDAPAVKVAVGRQLTHAPAVTMLHLFEDWKLKQTRPRTIGAVEKAVLEFRSVCGPLNVYEIEKAHARAYRDSLIEASLSKGTIENRLGFLSTLVRHGMKEMAEDLVKNPFERIDIVGAQGLRTPKNRRAFSMKELNMLFESALYTENERPQGQAVDAAYWTPLLGPFVGARIEELCQLRIEDIQRINGVWCIRICDLDDDQEVKTDSSFRRVPLHEKVIHAGFLVYAAKVAAAGHQRLFPTLSNENANRIFSNSVGKWFGRHLSAIGLGDPRLDFHSFRYTFKQQCSLCGISDEVRDALSGHWVGTKETGRAYLKGENKQYPYPRLVEAINQLKYEGLRLKHAIVDDPYAGTEVLLP